MKIKQVKGITVLADSSRVRLENIAFPTMERARAEVQHLFPHHLVLSEPGKISVVVKDRSFQVATFQEVMDHRR